MVVYALIYFYYFTFMFFFFMGYCSQHSKKQASPPQPGIVEVSSPWCMQLLGGGDFT